MPSLSKPSKKLCLRRLDELGKHTLPGLSQLAPDQNNDSKNLAQTANISPESPTCLDLSDDVLRLGESFSYPPSPNLYHPSLHYSDSIQRPRSWHASYTVAPPGASECDRKTPGTTPGFTDSNAYYSVAEEHPSGSPRSPSHSAQSHFRSIGGTSERSKSKSHKKEAVHETNSRKPQALLRIFINEDPILFMQKHLQDAGLQGLRVQDIYEKFESEFPRLSTTSDGDTKKWKAFISVVLREQNKFRKVYGPHKFENLGIHWTVDPSLGGRKPRDRRNRGKLQQNLNFDIPSPPESRESSSMAILNGNIAPTNVTQSLTDELPGKFTRLDLNARTDPLGAGMPRQLSS